MADHQHANHESGMDYAEHEATFKMFVAMTKWGTITVVAILVLMAIFLVH